MESNLERTGRSCQSLSPEDSVSGARSVTCGKSSSGSSPGFRSIPSSDTARESACSGSRKIEADGLGSSGSRMYFGLTFLGSKPIGLEDGSRRVYCLRREDCQLSILESRS